MPKPHYGYQWQKVRRRVLDACTICALCGHPGADSVDHIIPVSKGGALYDLANLRPAHHDCNSRRGNRPDRALMRTSRRW
jgi:5-methylcytosine-specific restriction endonuclease McrA